MNRIRRRTSPPAVFSPFPGEDELLDLDPLARMPGQATAPAPNFVELDCGTEISRATWPLRRNGTLDE